MDKEISVFGANGFIGSKFCEMYNDQIYIEPRESNVPKYDDVLYLISTTDNYNVFGDVHLDINTNLNKLMDVLPNVKGTFTFTSSWFVYGQQHLPVKEDTHCNPTGFYSITKKAAEDLLVSYCKTFNIKYRVLRLGNVYGKNDKGVSKKKNALQFLIEEIKNNRDVNLYFGGDFLRDYIYIDDVCRAIKLCMEKGLINEIINVSNGRGYKFKTLIDFVVKEINSKSRVGIMEQPEFHKLVQVRDMVLNTQKLESLGYKPEVDIYTGLKSLF